MVKMSDKKKSQPTMETTHIKNGDQCVVCNSDIGHEATKTAMDENKTFHTENEVDKKLGTATQTISQNGAKSKTVKKAPKTPNIKDVQKYLAVLFDDVTISDEDDKKKEEQKPADKGAETYSQLCKKYKKVPMNNVMRQFGKGVISLDGFDLSTKELKAFFVALLVCILCTVFVSLHDPFGTKHTPIQIY